MRIHYTAGIWQAAFYEYFTRALRELGHEVGFFNENGTPWQYFWYRALSYIPRRKYQTRTWFRRAVGADWLASVEAFKPDLIVFDFSANITPAVIEKAKRSTKAQIFYWLTSPAWGNNADDMLLAMKHADKIFTIDRAWSSTILFDFQNFIHLPLAGDNETFKPLPGFGEREREYDVVYLGGFPPQAPDGVARAYLVSHVSDKYNVATFGKNVRFWFENFPNLKERAKYDGYMPASYVNEVYNKSKLLLNIHTPFQMTSLSARTYEIGLSCAMQIVEYREDLDRLFPPGLIPSFRSVKEMDALIDEWVPDAKKREERSREIREHILRHHTWRHRAVEMLKYR